VPSRAVAKKSTTKRPDSIMDRLEEQQQQAYPAIPEKSQQPQGHIEVICWMNCCFCLQLETNASYCLHITRYTCSLSVIVYMSPSQLPCFYL
jgi:hypothetical protein